MKTKSLLTLLPAALLLAMAAFAAPPQLPDTPAARQFSAWLAAFNTGDKEVMRKFLAEHEPSRLARLDQTMQFREQTGGFVFEKLEASTPDHLTVIVKESASDQFGRLEIQVEAAEPYHITGISIEAIATPPDLKDKATGASPPPIPRLSETDALAALRAQLVKVSDDDRFAGAVIIAKAGKPVFTGAYGLSNREKKTANTLDTQFRIGSMNKMFTAVAVLQLAQAGKIKLTDPLGRYLPDYPNKDVATKVTIHELLTHTGGT
jgi:D-alanyl-D-alanine carboxypeptidase